MSRLVILAASVFEISCGKKQTNTQKALKTLYPETAVGIRNNRNSSSSSSSDNNNYYYNKVSP